VLFVYTVFISDPRSKLLVLLRAGVLSSAAVSGCWVARAKTALVTAGASEVVARSLSFFVGPLPLRLPASPFIAEAMIV